jgi:drug/metabolite transporter (DMT)-like permease
VTRAIHKPPTVLAGYDPVLLGTGCCILAAVVYSAANICLRRIAGTAPPAWAGCIKELVAVVVVTPWLISRLWRGLPSLPSGKPLAALILAGGAVQLLGNFGLIWCLGTIGISVTIPIASGVSLAGSALLGWLFLGERVSRRSMVAISLLIAAIVLLKLGADQEHRLSKISPAIISMAIGVVILAGVSFAMLTVAIRSTAAAATPPQGTAFVVTGVGVVILGPISLWQLGPAKLLATEPGNLSFMLLAGLFNFAGFLAITKGLHLTNVVHANVLSASQVAMAALAGILLFAEQPNPQLILGVVLTIVGMTLIDRPTNDEEAATDLGPP